MILHHFLYCQLQAVQPKRLKMYPVKLRKIKFKFPLRKQKENYDNLLTEFNKLENVYRNVNNNDELFNV